LARGHTAHFDVPLTGSASVRVDICTRPARILDVGGLVERATFQTLSHGTEVAIMGLDDLVQTKKTQRLKDWAVIENLMDVDMVRAGPADTVRVSFWLREARDPEVLVRLAEAAPGLAAALPRAHHVIDAARSGDVEATGAALLTEQAAGMAADRAYQRSLTAELEAMRHQERRQRPS
jgi:hypothetical protein